MSSCQRHQDPAAGSHTGKGLIAAIGITIRVKKRPAPRRGSLLDGGVALNDLAKQRRGYTSTIATISIDFGSTITI